LVVRVALGTTTLWTSRGNATVPAWLFTTDTFVDPIARVAIEPSAIGRTDGDFGEPTGPDIRPTRAARDLAAHHVTGADSLVTVAGDTIAFRVTASGCDDDSLPLVREDSTTVVLGGTHFPFVGSDAICAAEPQVLEFTVRLNRPIDMRTVLDVSSGRPLSVRNLPLGVRVIAPPSW